MAKRKIEKPETIKQRATVKEKIKEATYSTSCKNYVTIDKKEVEKLQEKFICLDITGGEGGEKRFTFSCSPKEAKEFLGGK
jgi:hypothetical protein